MRKTGVNIGCIIMASGISRRFGENKLLVKFGGKSLIQTVIDLTEKGHFTKRLVLTRTREVEEICKKQNIPVIYHELQKRNEAIRLGVEELQDMDGILFCPCDQPLLSHESLKQMVEEFRKYFESDEEDVILRLGYKEKVGTPVLFGKTNFLELLNLPEGSGGSGLCREHPERVRIIQAENPLELFDIDTQDDFLYLMKLREL